MSGRPIVVTLGIAMVIVITGVAMGRARHDAQLRGVTARGKALFAGDVALTGTIVGHTEPLPQDAVRCTNCHEASPAPASSAPSPTDTTESLGPNLAGGSLTRRIARRGGPPSSYEVDTFCRVLREGIDSASVMIPQTMPRYSMPNEDCHALWVFLTAPPRPAP